MKRLIPGLMAILMAPGLAAAQDAPQLPPYSDDRSTPEAVLHSYYNAIDRHEVLRAWSYFAQEQRPDYDTFKAGYTDTRSVTLLLGEAQPEGAAGTTYWSVPAAITATDADGTAKVFAGCYTLAQPDPQIQDTPPFAPIAIREGVLQPSDKTPEEALPKSCS
ncbi:hypothetical protein KM176_03830 [Pseudooceanicola sp. CBS1P-1]|uniref:DUF1176 domain-containing protein n=1 Tax=Pseudooceanicola albus TaxID=2692189 RepID=A0A6L7G584_9RHOB|nr:MULTISPECIES: hypothetical protein [Pseudooceanicola]MBT9382983.1 hypothetical protein [Pseudooceanicola endophyticus]MXN19171.1 hypothetical protein [Pseudooceanicola albus]